MKTFFEKNPIIAGFVVLVVVFVLLRFFTRKSSYSVKRDSVRNRIIANNNRIQNIASGFKDLRLKKYVNQIKYSAKWVNLNVPENFSPDFDMQIVDELVQQQMKVSTAAKNLYEKLDNPALKQKASQILALSKSNLILMGYKAW